MSLSKKFRDLNHKLRAASHTIDSIGTELKAKRPRRARRGHGSVAKRLEALLEKAGYTLDFFVPTQGYYLQNMADCWRWEAWGFAVSDTEKRNKLHFFSWDTMTECVRKKIVVDIDEDGDCWVSSLKSTNGRTTPEIATRRQY